MGNYNDLKNKEFSYSDISLIPQKSIVNSRSECDTSVFLGKYKFELPIIPANMKSVVNEDTCIFLAENKLFYIMHRFGNIDNNEFIKNMHKKGLFASISIGVNEDTLESLKTFEEVPEFITIDVANAWMQKTKDMIDIVRNKFPDTFLIVGNVATKEAVNCLTEWDVDMIKVGIGGGCFVKGTKIKTLNGLKNIEKIKIGDKVLTHKGKYKKVINLFTKIEKKELFIINNITCTGNHEFYVLNKKYKNIINDSNIDEFAEWIPANKLSLDYYLLKIKEG